MRGAQDPALLHYHQTSKFEFDSKPSGQAHAVKVSTGGFFKKLTSKKMPGCSFLGVGMCRYTPGMGMGMYYRVSIPGSHSFSGDRISLGFFSNAAATYGLKDGRVALARARALSLD